MRFEGSRTPEIEEEEIPVAVRSAGKVSARRTGMAVCMAK